MDSSAKQSVALVVAAAVCGVAYVVAHERRRRYKKAHPRAKPEKPEPQPEREGRAGAPGTLSAEGVSVVCVIEKDVLVAALLETADAAYSLIEQTRRQIYHLHKEKSISLEKAQKSVSADFQANMQLVVRAVHSKHTVTESQIAASLKCYREEPKVAEAYAVMNAAMSGEQPPTRPQTTSLARRKKRGNRS